MKLLTEIFNSLKQWASFAKESIFNIWRGSEYASDLKDYCFSFQTRYDLFLVKFYYNAAVWRFLKTFGKFAGKRLWWRPFLVKFQLFKMDSATGVFLSVFSVPFYRYFQTVNRTAFLWMITLLGAKTPESSNISRKVVAFSN